MGSESQLIIPDNNNRAATYCSFAEINPKKSSCIISLPSPPAYQSNKVAIMLAGAAVSSAILAIVLTQLLLPGLGGHKETLTLTMAIIGATGLIYGGGSLIKDHLKVQKAINKNTKNSHVEYIDDFSRVAQAKTQRKENALYLFAGLTLVGIPFALHHIKQQKSPNLKSETPSF